MPTPIKVLLSVILVLALLCGAAALYLFVIFNPNDYKDEIQTWVKQESGLELTINGDLSLSIFPWLGVSVNDVEMNTANGPLGAITQAQIYAKTRPLFFDRRLEVEGINFKGLNLNLEVDEQGVGNWQAVSSSNPQNRATQAKNKNTSLASAPLAAFSVAHMSVENAQINYSDLQTGSFTQLAQLNFKTSGVSLNSSFPLTANFDYRNSKQGEALPISLSTRITPDLDNYSATLDDLVLDMQQTRISGQLQITQLNTAANLQGTLQASNLNPSHWAAFLQSPVLAEMDLPAKLSTKLSVDMGTETATLKDLRLDAKPMQLEMTLKATEIASNPRYQGQVASNSFSLKTLLPILGIDIPQSTNPSALEQFLVKFNFSGDKDNLNISDLMMGLDQSTIKGQVSVNNFEKPKISYSLSGDKLDLDAYLPPAADTPEGEAAPEGGEAALLPIAMMRDLNMDGSLSLEQLIASGLDIDKLRFKANSKDGLITISNLSGNLYQGDFRINGKIDAREATPTINLSSTLNQVEAKPVLKKLADIDYLAGVMNLSLNASARGNSKTELLSSLNGVADFNVEQGLLDGVSLDRLICESIARIRQQPLSSAAPEQPNTAFNQFSGQLRITNGIVNSEQLNLGIERLNARGQGTLNLVEQTVDYGLKGKLLGDLGDEACRISDRFKDIEWPIRCQGKLDQEPSSLCGIDRAAMGKIVSRLAEAELKRKLGGDKLENELKEKLGDELGGKILDLIQL